MKLEFARNWESMPLMGRHAILDEERFDALARGLTRRVSRRGGVALMTIAVAMSASLPPVLHGSAEKDTGHKHRKKRRRENRREATPQTCGDCAGTCALCIAGPSVPLRCGDQVNIFCNFHCASDNDCLDSRPDYPHCVSQWVTRNTGFVTTGAEACARIAAPSAAYCSQIASCA